MDNNISQQSYESLTKSFKFQNRELLDNHVILALTDADGNIKHASTNLCLTFGYKQSELLDKPYTFLIYKDAIKTFEIQFNDAKTTKSIWKGEIKHSSASDNIIWADTIVTPLIENKELIGFIFASNDVTKEKKLKKLNEENLLKKKYDDNILEFLPSLSAAVLLKTSSSFHKVLWVMTVAILSTLIWAYFAEIDDIVKSDGKIITTTNIQTVSSLEGGVLDEVFVREGDIVQKDDKLLQISNVPSKSEYEKKYLNKIELLAKITRLNAEVNGIAMVPNEEVVAANKSLMDFETRLFSRNMDKLSTSIKILREKQLQKENELKENIDKLKIVKNSYQLLQKEIEIKKTLAREKIISEVEYLQLKKRFNDTDIELRAIESLIQNLKSIIDETHQSIAETRKNFIVESNKEFVVSYAEIKKIDEELKSLEDKMRRTTLLAPKDGIINRILIKTKGEAISSGKVLLEIVPKDDFILAEVKIKPSDIGFLYTGQHVNLKIRAYDFSLYGNVQGEISYISADTIMDEKAKEEFYIVHIKSKNKYVGDNKNLIIKTGMTVDSDIIVGKKTVLNFILKPITKTLQL